MFPHRSAFLAPLAALLGACGGTAPPPPTQTAAQEPAPTPLMKADAEWKTALTPEQYFVLRQKGTERAGTGKYDKHLEPGTYVCAGCGHELFVSDSKFDAGCGWPSFSSPATPAGVKENPDASHGMVRTEVTCAKCGGHLGHVFDDGPAPTGLRYCINSAALGFKPKSSK